MSNIDYTNSIKYNYNLVSKKNNNNIKLDQSSDWNFSELLNHLLNNKKQICLLFLVFIIIFVIEKISFYNSLMFASPSVIPGIANNIKNIIKNDNNDNNGKNDKKKKK